MNILLIKPRGSVKSGQLVPPLGLLYLSASLKKEGYKSVKIIHLEPGPEPVNQTALEREMVKFKPDVVGLSALTAEARSMHDVASFLKAAVPEACIIAGGPHATAYTEDCLRNDAIDIAVRQEGEQSFSEIIKGLEKRMTFDAVKGISFKRDGRIIHNPRRELLKELDSLPLPDWGAIDIDRYKNHIPQSPFFYGLRYMSIVTSRGCPYYCSFCHNIMGKEFRAHSPKRVLEELRVLHNDFKINNIEITDDIFNFDRKRAADIMRGIVASGLKFKIHFSNGVRGDLLDEEIIDLFAQAGVTYMCVAVETASPRLQVKIKKNIQLDKLKKVIAYSERKRIFVNGFFMLGFPDETIKEMLLTVSFAIRSRLHTAMIAFCLGYRGTELGDALKDTCAVNPDNDISLYSSCRNVVNCSSYDARVLGMMKHLMNLLFYANPIRIYRIFRDLPNCSPRILYLLAKKLVTRTIIPR